MDTSIPTSEESKHYSARQNILSGTLNVIGEQVSRRGSTSSSCTCRRRRRPVSPLCQSPRDLGGMEGATETRTGCATDVPAPRTRRTRTSPTKKPLPSRASNKRRRPTGWLGLGRTTDGWPAALPQVDLPVPGQLLDLEEPLSSPLKRQQRLAACESRRVVAMVIELPLLIVHARLALTPCMESIESRENQ